MKETTTHCDQCGNPLGLKCDWDRASAERAARRGIWSFDAKCFGDSGWMFFCDEKCWRKFLAEKREHGITKTSD